MIKDDVLDSLCRNLILQNIFHKLFETDYRLGVREYTDEFDNVIYFGIEDEGEGVCIMEITQEEYVVLKDYIEKEIKNKEDK